MAEVIAEKFPFKASLMVSSSIFLERKFKGLATMLFFSLLSTSSILGMVSNIFSSLTKTPLVKVQESFGLTFKINQVSKRPNNNPTKLAIREI
jgi:hypothetical protein